MDDLDAWHTAAMDRGTPVATEPTEESFGRYAEVVDPDGHLVVFREPVEALPNPASIAESFEDDTPHTGGFRKPVRKPSRSVSRAVHSARRPAPANASHAQRGAGIDEGVTVPSNGGGAHTATAKAAGISGHHKPKSNLRLRSVRGGGEERTREYPRNRFDVKRARAKPGIGRAEKEKQRMLSQQKTTTAQVSKSHPVKHAAARQAPGRGGRIVARTLQRAATRPVARAAARVTVRTTARAGAARASGRAGAARTTSARTTAARATARSTKRTAAPKRAAARTTRTRTAARSAARTRTSPARKSARKTRSSRSR
jgi:hypothetical protein